MRDVWSFRNDRFIEITVLTKLDEIAEIIGILMHIYMYMNWTAYYDILKIQTVLEALVVMLLFVDFSYLNKVSDSILQPDLRVCHTRSRAPNDSPTQNMFSRTSS